MFLSQKLLKQQSYQKENIVHPRVRVNTFKSITRQIVYISTTSFKDDPYIMVLHYAFSKSMLQTCEEEKSRDT